MLDQIRLFRVLVLLSREKDLFLLAQDSVTILRSLLNQLDGLQLLINEYSARENFIRTNYEDNNNESLKLKSAVASLEMMVEFTPEIKPIISNLLNVASHFWFCGPLDNDKSPQTRKAIERWRIYHDHRDEIPQEFISQMKYFKQECEVVISRYFSDRLEALEAEEENEKSVQSSLCDSYIKYATFVPMGLRVPFEKSTNSFVLISDFPLTHIFVADKKMCNLFGCSMARMLALPTISFIVNSGCFNSLVADLIHSRRPSVSIMYYRTMRRQVKALFWEISVIEGHYISRGVDITTLLHATKTNETANTDKMLRQWLHSIRNASFQQQAEVLQEDIAEIKAMVGDRVDVGERFKKVEEGLRTLVYTTKATVGLIDQAMETKMDKCTSVEEFVANAQSAGNRFVARDARFFSSALNVFELYVEGNLSPTSALRGMYVKGDMHDLRAMIDELYSNAVRFTHPERGVKVQFHIHALDSSIQFMVDIEDYAPDGLPEDVVGFYENHISPTKIVRINGKACEYFDKSSPDSESMFIQSSQGSRTLSAKSKSSGITRVVDVFHSMTANGEVDVDIRIMLKPLGTIHSINFCLPILLNPKPVEETAFTYDDADEKVVLVVDDSHVVRRIVGKYLQKINVPFHSCVDGVEALEWFMDNMDSCFGVLTDLEMPRMGGNALIDRLKQICPHMPCMIVSGNNIAVESCPAGALRAILKPITLEQIRGAVAELRSHGAAVQGLGGGGEVG